MFMHLRRIDICKKIQTIKNEAFTILTEYNDYKKPLSDHNR